MRCAEKVWALIRHAGSAPEASIGSKPIGSELADIPASLAPKCQGFVDGRAGCSLRAAWKASSADTGQVFDIQQHFSGHWIQLANPGRPGACR